MPSKTSILMCSQPASVSASRRAAATATMALFLLLCLVAAPRAAAQYGDARLGAELLRSRQCIDCHSVMGKGGGAAPDLARRSMRDFTPAALAAQIWNHGPKMWAAIEARNLTIEPLSADDANNLFAYFYALRFFDPPGDAGRGKRVFDAKKCSECHKAARDSEGGIGPPIAELPRTATPIEWAQQMWNHSSRMLEEMQKRGISWPTFTVREMVDLLVYLDNLPGGPNRELNMLLAGPETGERLFREKGCAECHSLGASEAGKIDLLRRMQGMETLTAFAVDMWNHGGQMQQQAQRTGKPFPMFERDEMSELVSFLFARRYFEQTGNASRGASVFNRKNCAACHGVAGSGAPDLSAKAGQYSAPMLTSAFWRHGPRMLVEMQRRSLPWPELTGAQMADLIAHLNTK